MTAVLTDIPRDRLDEVLFGALRAIYRFQLVKVSEFNLDYEEIYLLQFLRRHSPARMGDIAAEMGIPISTATRVVDRLQRKKRLGRRRDPADRRNVLVTLRPAGERAVRMIEEHTFALLMRNVEQFTEADIFAFFKTAVNMEKILSVE